LHVGPHKTGTTLIQKCLIDNRSVLAAAGYDYPNNYFSYLGHHGLWSKVKNRQLDIIEGLDVNRNIILSSENFASFDQSDFEYIRESFSAWKIVVIYSWRRAGSKMYSLWQEHVKQGGEQGFYEYYHNELAFPGGSKLLNSFPTLKVLATCFGKSAIKVIDYNECQANDSLLSDFFGILQGVDFLNIALTDEVRRTYANKAMSLYEIEIIRYLNMVLREKYGCKGDTVRTLYLANRSKLPEKELKCIEQRVSKHLKCIDVGNYFIDRNSQFGILKEFSSQIVNFNPEQVDKSLILTLEVTSSGWLYNSDIFEALATIEAIVAAELQSG